MSRHPHLPLPVFPDHFSTHIQQSATTRRTVSLRHPNYLYSRHYGNNHSRAKREVYSHYWESVFQDRSPHLLHMLFPLPIPTPALFLSAWGGCMVPKNQICDNYEYCLSGVLNLLDLLLLGNSSAYIVQNTSARLNTCRGHRCD